MGLASKRWSWLPFRKCNALRQIANQIYREENNWELTEHPMGELENGETSRKQR